jgi:hypothetical protein
MDVYEIRILPHGRGPTIIESMHLNDHAAVRAAQKTAAGNPFEVWRVLDCIYGPSPYGSGISSAPHQ